MLIEPYGFQKAAVSSIFDYFKKNTTGNPIVALPTGTGKSVVIAAFLYEVLTKYRNQKILILTHRKELIEQDYKELLAMWPQAPAGVYSAGLNKKQHEFPIVFCGIGSVCKQVEKFGKVDLIIIDEAHLVSPKEETMYQFFLNELSKTNPYLRVIGLSATYWRLGHGLLTENHIFTDLCFNMTDLRSFNWLLDQGYLCPLIPKQTNLEIDISGVRIQSGEYKLDDLQLAVDREEITYRAIKEMVENSIDRKHWLIFSTGIEHTEHIASMFNDMFNIPAVAIHSKLKDKERDNRIADFKAGGYQVAVNNNILTTGFNDKAIDLLGVLRHTQSSALWVQMMGRGTRTLEGKLNCIVYDFARNTQRLGPINDPVIPPSPKSKGRKQAAPIKICQLCNTYNHASVRICVGCGHKFESAITFEHIASTMELIKREEPPVIETFNPVHITYALHHKKERPDSLKVTYFCGTGTTVFTEYIGFAHEGFARKKAEKWWAERGILPVPQDSKEALSRSKSLISPKYIKVHVNKKYPEITEYLYQEPNN